MEWCQEFSQMTEEDAKHIMFVDEKNFGQYSSGNPKNDIIWEPKEMKVPSRIFKKYGLSVKVGIVVSWYGISSIYFYPKWNSTEYLNWCREVLVPYRNRYVGPLLDVLSGVLRGT